MVAVAAQGRERRFSEAERQAAGARVWRALLRPRPEYFENPYQDATPDDLALAEAVRECLERGEGKR